MNMTIHQKTNGQAQSLEPECHADPDLALVERAQAGEHAAFNILVLQYKKRVFHIILRITKNREDAEDQVQETFLCAYRGLNAFRGHSLFSSWLTRIAVNQVLQCLRKRQHDQISIDQSPDMNSEGHPFEIPETRANPEQLYVAAEMLAQVHRRMGKLPASLKSVLVLRLYRDFTPQETASALGISMAAVKSRTLRGRRRLCDI